MSHKRKNITLLIILLVAVVIVTTLICRKSRAVQLSNPDKIGYQHPIIAAKGKNLTSVNIQGYKGSDTFVVIGNTGNWLLNQDSGLDAKHPLVFINTSRMIKCGGVQSENCQYVTIIGQGSKDAYGFEFRGGGVAGSFGGMYKGLTILSCRFTGASQGSLWVKEEAPHACDFYNYWKNQPEPGKSTYSDPYKYLAPNFIDSVDVEHCWIDSCGGDTYFGSTGTINGREPIPCLANKVLPTEQMKNINFSFNYVNYMGRSGFQLSLAVGGVNKIMYNTILNSGYEFPETHSAASKNQGAGIRTGSGDVNVEIAYNTVKYSNIYNYDLEEANVNFHNNTGDSVSYLIYHNAIFACGQAIPSTILSASNPQKSASYINNNKMYNTTGGSGIAYAIYGGKNFTNVFVNDTCGNVGKSSVLSTPFRVSTDCGSSPVYKDTTYSIVHDTLVDKHYPPEIVRSFDSTAYDTLSVGYIKINGKRLYKVTGRFRNYSVADTIKGAYDSTGTIQTPPHDTTVKILVSGTKTAMMNQVPQRKKSPIYVYEKIIFDNRSCLYGLQTYKSDSLYA
jgi:hypothetical protein